MNFPIPVEGLPTAEERLESVATRLGLCVASTCAIMPPMEKPTTWARRTAR